MRNHAENLLELSHVVVFDAESLQRQRHGLAADPRDLPAVELGDQVRHVARNDFDQCPFSSLALRVGEALRDGGLGLVDIAPALFGKRAYERAGVLLGLLVQLLRKVLPFSPHRMRGSGVGAGGHRCDVAGQEQEESGGRRLRARRRHEGRNRHLRKENRRAHFPRGGEKPAGSREDHDHEGGVLSFGVRQNLLQIARRGRMNRRIDPPHDDERSGRGSRPDRRGEKRGRKQRPRSHEEMESIAGSLGRQPGRRRVAQNRRAGL